MRIRDFVYLGSGNYVPLTLTDGGEPIEGGIATIDRALATLSDPAGEVVHVVDSDASPAAFDWLTGAAESEIRLAFGNEPIPVGRYDVRLETIEGGGSVVWCDPGGPVILDLTVVAAPA